MKKINIKEVEVLKKKELRSIEGGNIIIGNLIPLPPNAYPIGKRPVLIRDRGLGFTK